MIRAAYICRSKAAPLRQEAAAAEELDLGAATGRAVPLAAAPLLQPWLGGQFTTAEPL